MIKHLIFDLDDTLWHFKKNSELILKTLFEEQRVEMNFGIKFNPWHHVYYEGNERLWADLRDKKIQKHELRDLRFKQSFEHFNIFDGRLNSDFESQYIERLTDNNHLFDGVEKALEELSHDFTIHVLTNGFQDVSERKIGRSALQKYVVTLTSADAAGTRKPDPKIFEIALKKAQATANEVIFIGDDWIADIEGAHRVGMSSIFFNSNNKKVNNTLKIPETNDFNEIPKLIKNICSQKEVE